MAVRKVPLVDHVAASVGRRGKVNWPAVLEQAKTPAQRRRIEALKAIAGVESAYRRLPDHWWSRFALRGAIAKGAYGTVYRAWDPLLQRDVALKILHDTSDASAILEEGRFLAQLNHENIVQVHGIEEFRGAYALRMELVEGLTVEQHLDMIGRMSPRETAAMGMDLSRALSAAHRTGVLHRDIKAQNVIRRAANQKYVLTDFGGGERRRRGARDNGRIMGTPLYLAPEILLRGESATIASDIYSLGVLLYHAVTKEYPIKGDTLEEVCDAHTRGPVPLSMWRSDLPTRFTRVIERAISPEPARRQRSADELHRELELASQAEIVHAAATQLTFKPSLALPSVAVLPFVNVGPDEDVEHICSGVAAEIITGLGNVPGLRVASRLSSFAPEHLQNTDVPSICARLRTNAVLQGQVRKSGNQLRITAQLLNGADGHQVWADAFGEEVQDLLKVQESIAQRVVRGMHVKLSYLSGGRLTRSHTDNPRAYEAYLRGRHSWGKRYEGGFGAALKEFEEAIKEDAAYPLALAGLADTYAFLGFYSITQPRAAFAKARLAAERALKADQLLPEAHTSMGLIKLGDDWKPHEAARLFAEAIRLDQQQNDVFARIYLSWVQVLTKDVGEALVGARLAQESEPSEPLINSGAAHTFFLAGRYDEAIAYCENARHFDPDCIVAIYLMAACRAKQARLGEAISLMEQAVRQSQGAPFYLAILGNLYGRAGRTNDALDVLERLRNRQGYVPPHSHAFVYAGLNDLDRAFEWQAKAYEDGASPFNYFSPLIDNMQTDPRHHRDLERMGWPKGGM